MDDLQSWWEVPSIAHFCSLFRVAFDLLDFDIEELEEALLTDGTEDSGSSLLQELIVRLLCGCLNKKKDKEISTSNYQMFLRRLFRQKCREYGMANPFNSDIDFQFLPLRTKVEILLALTDFRLDAPDVLDVLKDLDSNSLRVQPLGLDENRSAYWYFYGTRLYREDYPKRKKKKKARERKHGRKSRSESEPEFEGDGAGDSDGAEMGAGEWRVECFTESDWERLAVRLEDSESKRERALHTVLAEDFLPEIPRLFEEKERLQRKRLMELQPRKSSRIEKLKHQKETEKKVLEQKIQEEQIRQEEVDRKEQERIERDARRAREHRAMLRSRSHSNSDCSSERSGVEGGAKPPRARQTNNSLSSATGQIIIQPSRQKLRTSQVFQQSIEDLRTGLYKILDRIKNHKDAWPFTEPVDEEYAPRYYSVIAKPMDLQKMEDKLDAGRYPTFKAFKSDFQLIVNNCRQYNGSENEYTEMVGKLQEVFDGAVDRYLEAEISTDEEVAVEFPGEQRGRRKRRRKMSDTSKPSPPPSPRSNESEEDQIEVDEGKGSPTEEEEGEAEEEKDIWRSRKERERERDGSEPRRHRSSRAKENQQPRNKPGAVKNVADIEALELATEQTLKDINKWLASTPPQEFSSGSNSPSQFASNLQTDECDGSVTPTDNEYHARLKMRTKDKMDYARRRFFKDHIGQKRRREMRTIDRLQPGKGKGNLLSNLTASKNEDSLNLVGVVGNKTKDQKTEKSDKDDDTAPKLSLGTVLNSFGQHSFEHSDSEMIITKNSDSQDESSNDKPSLLDEDVKTSPEDVEKPTEEEAELSSKLKDDPPVVNTFEKKPSVQNVSMKTEKSSTPNLSAWFKAFGLPKSQPSVKKKTEAAEPEPKPELSKSLPKETEEIISVSEDKEKLIIAPPLISPARRQRKTSTGSSVSERSSFSQDPTDPLADGLSPRPSIDEPYLSPQADPSKTPYHNSPHHNSPLNGTIRVGFYQDTSFPRGSSDKSSSPREPPTPNCSPREPPSCSPRDLPSCSPRDLPSCSPRDLPSCSPRDLPSCSPRDIPSCSPRSLPSCSPRDLPGCSPREPMPSPKSDYPVYSGSTLPYRSPSINAYDAPVSPYPAHVSYYDTSKPIADRYRSIQPQAATEKSVSSTYPVKKRIYSEVESPARASPDLSYRGGSFTPTRNAIENDRSFTPTPGRIPTQAATRHAYPAETAIALGLHGMNPHLLDPYSAGYFGGDSSIYGKNTPSTTSIAHSMFPPASGTMTTANYSRDDRGYTRLSSNYADVRTVKASDNSSYSTLQPTNKTQTPVINYSSRCSEILSTNSPRSSSPLNYSNTAASNLLPKTSTQSELNYMNRCQEHGKMNESPLDFAKASQSETKKDSSSHSYQNRSISESLPPKVNSPYNRMADLTSPMNFNSPDLVGGKLGVSSPINFPQPDIIAGKVNYSHPMSDLARFNYSHGVGYNHPMSDLIQSKGSSGAYPNRPVDLMATGYNRQIADLLPSRDLSYQSVMRPTNTPTTKSDVAAKPATKKSSKKRKSESPAVQATPGFQQYLGQTPSEAISLKTSSVVPGSAFNFGPAPLKDSYASYLEDIRSSGYFAPHSKPSAGAKSSSPGPHPTASPFQYLSHPQTYSNPFMNTTYQQLLQKHPDELLRPMVLHQGLLPPSNYPAGYLSMHEGINPTWL